MKHLKVKFCKATIQDVKQIRNVHLRAFQNFFLTELGGYFLDTYYNAVIKYHGSVAYCAYTDDNKLVGFVTGCYSSIGYNKKLLFSSFFSFLNVTIIILFTKPKALYRLFNNMSKKSNPVDQGNYAELLSISVDPDYSGNGIGKKLIELFEEDVKYNGVTEIALTTDYYNNCKVIDFYFKNGFQVYYDFVTYPYRRMYKLIKKIN